MDLTFPTPQGWFNYRVGAIVLDAGSVLMARNDTEPYYYSVGGRVHLGETAEEAVRREVAEELGAAPASARLVVVHENFFPWTEPPAGPCHELSMFFLVTMPPGWALDPAREGIADGALGDDPHPERHEWLPISHLSDVEAYPTWFADLGTMPLTGIVHIVTHEDSAG